MTTRPWKFWTGNAWGPLAELPGVSIPVATDITTSTTIAASSTSVNQGTNVTFTATVSQSPSVGTVQFQFLSGSTWTNYSTPVAVAAGKATLVWTVGATTYQWRAVYSGSGNYTASTSSAITVTAKTQKTATKTVNATWTRSYQSDGSARSGILEAYQGYYSSTNGNQRSLIGFGALALPSGSTVTKVEGYVYAAHWGDSGGGTGIFGYHGYSAAPASYVTGGTQNAVQLAWSSKTGGKWFTLPAAANAGFQSGANKGFIVGPGPSTSTLAYYGYFNGYSQSSAPQLRVTYTYWA